MKTDLSAEQIAFYRENGFVVLDEFLSPQELETWRAAVDAAVAARGKRKISTRDDMVEKDEYYDRVFVQRINLWQDNPAMRELILDERIGQMAAALEGIDGIRVWHDQALIKQPWGNPTAWHLDAPYWSFSSVHSISIWIALDDATLQNGCLYFLPGSHKKQSFDNVGIGQNIGDLFRVYPEFGEIEPVPAPMKAGSCSFHNGLVAHGAGANMTPRSRRAMTCAFMPDGSTFNGKQNILTKAEIERLNIGDPLNDEAQNPLVYSRDA